MADDSFLGNALNGIDSKNRVSIPASFRDVISLRSEPRTVILAPAERAECLVGYDAGYATKMRTELEARFAGDYSDARDDRFRAAFGSAEKASIDDTGRIILSQSMKDTGEIDRLALFWGMGAFFEVWNPHRLVERPNLDPRVIRTVRRLLDARGAG